MYTLLISAKRNFKQNQRILKSGSVSFLGIFFLGNLLFFVGQSLLFFRTRNWSFSMFFRSRKSFGMFWFSGGFPTSNFTILMPISEKAKLKFFFGCLWFSAVKLSLHDSNLRSHSFSKNEEVYPSFKSIIGLLIWSGFRSFSSQIDCDSSWEGQLLKGHGQRWLQLDRSQIIFEGGRLA